MPLIAQEKVKEVDYGTFMSMTGLMKVEIDPEVEIESIPTGAFYNCQYLMDITLPESQLGQNF